MQSIMPENLKQALAHVLWIGGTTDAGKTTIAQLLGERCRTSDSQFIYAGYAADGLHSEGSGVAGADAV